MCWCCVLIHYQLIFIIILYGFVYRYNGANVIWHSGPIVEVLTPHQVKTKSSSEYVLVGKLDFETAIAKGTYFEIFHHSCVLMFFWFHFMLVFRFRCLCVNG